MTYLTPLKLHFTFLSFGIGWYPYSYRTLSYWYVIKSTHRWPLKCFIQILFDVRKEETENEWAGKERERSRSPKLSAGTKIHQPENKLGHTSLSGWSGSTALIEWADSLPADATANPARDHGFIATPLQLPTLSLWPKNPLANDIQAWTWRGRKG